MKMKIIHLIFWVQTVQIVVSFLSTSALIMSSCMDYSLTQFFFISGFLKQSHCAIEPGFFFLFFFYKKPKCKMTVLFYKNKIPSIRLSGLKWIRLYLGIPRRKIGIHPVREAPRKSKTSSYEVWVWPTTRRKTNNINKLINWTCA